MKIWTEPRVTRITPDAGFKEPEHLPVIWGDEAACVERAPDHPERLIEYAGRLCYMSQHNPAGKTTEQYLDHIIEVDHGSVLEHVSVSFLLEGISRTLSHELVRHRAGTAFSQLSQRFVEHLEVVMPPAICESLASVQQRWTDKMLALGTLYETQLKDLYEVQGLRGKKLKEAARSVLPGCAETKMVMTANVRAWRLILKRRIAPEADAEIQRLAREILRQLQALLPSCFKDIQG